MNENRESKSVTPALRASDAEREHVAKLVGEAAGEGRLTLAEAEDRLARIYVATYRHELDGFVTDLPASHPARPSTALAARVAHLPVRLRVHAAVAVAMSVMLILRFVASGAEFFWPAGPMFFLWGSLAVHASVVARTNRGRA